MACRRPSEAHRKKTETLDLLFSLAIPEAAQKELEDAVASGKVIPREKLKTDYSPKKEDLDALTIHLKAEGFEIIKTNDDRTGVYARAAASQIEKTLQVDMVSVFREGVTYTAARNAPSLPNEASAGVRAIIGLQPFRHMIKRDIRVPNRRGNRVDMPGLGLRLQAAGPVANTNIANVPPYLVSEVLKAYNANGPGVAHGAGEKIAILIDTFPVDADVQAFWALNGLPNNLARIAKINVKGVPLPQLPPATGEESMDVEWASGIAPGAGIRVYASSSLAFVDLNLALDQIIADLATEPQLHQLSISLGLGETFMGGPQGIVATEHQKFLQLAAAGVNVFVSSGDAGSRPDAQGNFGGPLQAEYQSSDSAVIGVGGTSLTLNNGGGVASETAWTGSGGGISIFFNRPVWQVGPGVPPGGKRLVPDVSLLADPKTGALIVLHGHTRQFGGTSLAAPVWGGFCALINSSRATASKPPVGFLNPQIYPLMGGPSFRDIVSGSNGLPNRHQFDAGPGYDLVTGIGVPDIQALNNALP